MNTQSLIPAPNSEIGGLPVLLSGVLDQYSAESLKQQLVAARVALASSGNSELVINMAAVEHIDASALQVLIACQGGLNQGKLRIEGANSSIMQWIKLAGADALFEFSDRNSEAEAV